MVDIGKVINRHATIKSLNAGMQLFMQASVIEFSYSRFDDQYLVNAKVIGSTGNQYIVSLKVSKSNLEEALCSCPYDWGGVCKHIVSASLQLKESLSNEKKEILINKITTATKLKNRKTSEPFECAIYNTEVIDLTNAKTYHKIKNNVWRYHFDYTFEDGVIKINLFSQHNYGFDGGEKEYKVILREGKEKGQVSITSSPVKVVSDLSEEELIALLLIERNNIKNVYRILDADFSENYLMKEAASYGIQNYETAKKYFSIEFSNSNFAVTAKKGGPKLLKVKSTDNLKTRLNINQLIENSILNGTTEVRRNKRLSFYVLNERRNNEYNILSIIPFIVRIKKNGGFHNGIIANVYDQPDYEAQVEIDEVQNKLIGYCRNTVIKNFQRKLSYKTRDIDNQLEKKLYALNDNLSQVREIWLLLKKEEINICLSTENEFYDDVIYAQDLAPDFIVEFSSPILFELEFKDELYELAPKIIINGQKHAVRSSDLVWIHSFLYRYQNRLYLLNSVKDTYYLFDFLEGKTGYASLEENFSLFFEEVVKPVSKEYTIDIGELSKGIIHKIIQTEKMKRSIFLKEMDNFILLRPFMFYGETDVNVLDGAGELSLDGNTIITVERDFKEEKLLKGFLINSHSSFKEGTNQDFLNLSLSNFIEDYWFLDFIDKARENNIEIYGFNDFKNFHYATDRATVNLNTSSGTDWFDVEVQVTVGDTIISLREVKKAILSKDKYIKLGDGKLAILPQEWINKLENYLRIGKVEKGNIKISKFGFNVLEEVFNEKDQEAIRKEIRDKKDELRNFEQINEVNLPEINATLRDYQKQGYSWLHFLHQFGWGGILADDMGLGKTLQVITFIKSLVDKGIHTHLIVVPTSLLFNWQNEIKKFCPSLKYVIYHGVGREKETTSWKKNDLIITTYGVVISDFDILKRVNFNYVILDESQAIKNPLSKRYKAITSLKAKNRLAMTGTPIENNTFDLYAQITFTNPGFFISTEHFKKNYSTPIDRDGNQQVANELNKMINPFILRRTKELVATELPSKTEDVIYCQMEEDQRKVYDAFRNKFRNELMGTVEEQGIENSKLQILQALTKIRQICDSPALLSDDENYGNQSIKIKELLRHIKEKTSGHKILVFSQFVGMLTLIRKELEKNELTYAYLDGQTTQKNREAAVNLFQEDESVRVFLISLKAGGTGLNLTAADYVYLVDPWWNPAVENQAIDRCYRIGQEKKVIAYRMICKDTIEEKIMNYKARKQSVADSIIKTDESILKQLTKQDMVDLFT